MFLTHLVRPSFLNFIHNHTDNIILHHSTKITKKFTQIHEIVGNLTKKRSFLTSRPFSNMPLFDYMSQIGQNATFCQLEF